MSFRSPSRTALSLVLLATACASAEGEVSGGAEDAVVDTRLFREFAPWTGRLVLPTVDERQPDGAVKIEVHNSPDASLKGKTVWLRFAEGAALSERVRDVTRSVAFTDATRKSMAKGNIHPERINGWKDVGPLESLAGAHATDDVLVALPTAVSAGGAILVAREPVMIAGDYVGLVQIKSPAAGGAFKIAHYKKSTGDFDGPEQTLAFDAVELPVGPKLRMVSPVEGLEKADPNRLDGFYVHAVEGPDGKLHARALVPRRLRNVRGSVNVRRGASESLLYATAGMWTNVEDAAKGKKSKGTSSSTLLVPNGASADWQKETLTAGKKLLVVHSFGSVGPDEDGAFRSGHFAFGIGTIAAEPLTGDLALDVEYKQVYAHNQNGIIAGSHDYASFAGGFARGWMYSRPLADVALYLPALDREYKLGGAGLWKPIDGLERELDSMAARYRTGMGTGASVVTPANSCVQDTSKAVYFALSKLREKTNEAAVREFIEANPNNDEVKDYKKILVLGSTVEKYLTPLGIARSDWRNQVNSIAATDVNACPGGIVGAVFCGLASYNTIIPRSAADFYSEALILAGAGGVALRTNMVGSEMPGLFPLSPTRLIR